MSTSPNTSSACFLFRDNGQSLGNKGDFCSEIFKDNEIAQGDNVMASDFVSPDAPALPQWLLNIVDRKITYQRHPMIHIIKANG